VRGQLDSYRVSVRENSRLVEELDLIRRRCEDAVLFEKPDALAIRVPYGGTEFPSHALVTAETLQRMEALIGFAPLHIPPIVTLIQCCQRVFPDLPVVLLFETAFFTALPRREYIYGLEANFTEKWALRRYGFNGLFHEAAYAYLAEQQTAENKRDRSQPYRVLSICLEPQPEIAAIVQNRAITVTSGVTPLEGLPGQTTCGELDSSIILTLAEKMNWGPEKINAVLTKESGLKGMAGSTIDWIDLFTSHASEVRQARDVVQYRFLLACGSSIAAMGGVDRLVFSGRYARMGDLLGSWLASRLPMINGDGPSAEPPWVCYPVTLDRIMVDKAAMMLLSLLARTC